MNESTVGIAFSREVEAVVKHVLAQIEMLHPLVYFSDLLLLVLFCSRSCRSSAFHLSSNL